MRFDDEIEKVVRRIRKDAKDLCARIDQRKRDAIADEDDFTSEFARSIRESLNEKRTGGLRWSITTRKLTSKGRGSEEKIFGADLVIVFSLNSSKISYNKGVLIQAKLDRQNGRNGLGAIEVGEKKRLSAQCANMLNVTPESFVWVYKKDQMEVYKASSIVSRSEDSMSALSPTKIGSFFREALICKIGDSRITSSSSDALKILMDEHRVKFGISVEGYSDDVEVTELLDE